MSEVVFPLLGTAFVVLVLLPGCALVAKAFLWGLERAEARGPLHGLRLRYLVLTGSSALPLVWLLSATLHQAETGSFVVGCLFDHETAALCFEPGLFSAFLLGLIASATVSEMRRARAVVASVSADAAALVARIAHIASARPELRFLENKVDAVDEFGYAVGTQGLFAPRIAVGIHYAAISSDDELASALGHEAEHVRARDPLRYLVLSLALAVNPFGKRFLQTHAASWLAAREAHCDREAVIRGAEPLPLAEALVRAARPAQWSAAALGAQSASLLRLRVEMLLAFAERPPVRCCHREPASLLIVAALFVATAVLPHHTGTAALDALHVGTEHALHFFWR